MKLLDSKDRCVEQVEQTRLTRFEKMRDGDEYKMAVPDVFPSDVSNDNHYTITFRYRYSP